MSYSTIDRWVGERLDMLIFCAIPFANIMGDTSSATGEICFGGCFLLR
jgi:hypothetical protein